MTPWAPTMVATSEPFVDRSNPGKPFVVRLRSPSGTMIEFHRFNKAEDAWAFYEEHRA